MFKKKKAQGLPITTIVIAVIAIIVLVVLIAVFSGKLSDFSTGVKAAGKCSDICKAAGYTSGTLTATGGAQTGGIIDSGGNKCTCA